MIPQDAPPKSFTKKTDNAKLTVSLSGSTLALSLTHKDHPGMSFQTQFSPDTLPQYYKILFQTPLQMYDYLQQNDLPQMTTPQQLGISYKIGKQTRTLKVIMTPKRLSTADLQTFRIRQLQEQMSRLRQIQSQRVNQDLVRCRQELSDMQNLNSTLRIELQQCQDARRTIWTLQAQKLRAEEQCQSLKSKIQNLEATISTQEYLYSALQQEFNQYRTNMQAFGSQQNSSQLNIFKTMPNSTNFASFSFINNNLKLISEFNSQLGKLIPSSTPIPAKRSIFKIKVQDFTQYPHFAMGLMTHPTIQTATSIKGGDPNAVMYYCDQNVYQVIYQGAEPLHGFHVQKGTIISLVIDRPNRKIQWQVNSECLAVSHFTQAMIQAAELYVFIQLWKQGDSLTILSS